MLYLLAVSLIWAFSFGLIKGELTGINAFVVSFARLFISLIIFLPFLRIKQIDGQLRLKLMLAGAVQYGLMYVCYIYSYQFLQAYEVALFTVFTPFYVVFINQKLEKKSNKIFYVTSAAAVIGAAIVVYKGLASSLAAGFLLVQVSNICFAFGQVYYKHLLKSRPETSGHSVFALLYAGAVLAVTVPAAFSAISDGVEISASQWGTLAYLGIVASGLGFYLWNTGARKSNAGTLAIFNNLKIPLAIAVSILFFGESADTIPLLIGSSVIIASLLANEYYTGEGPRIPLFKSKN